MSRKDRRTPKKPQIEAPGSDGGGERPAALEIEARPASSQLEELARAGLDRETAIFVAAYMRVRDEQLGALEVLRELRAHPWIWSAVVGGDYMRFGRACEMCGVPAVSVPELQAAVTLITNGPAPARAREPAPPVVVQIDPELLVETLSPPS
jgi:hypothetical protein